jgi:hypothetical protein
MIRAKLALVAVLSFCLVFGGSPVSRATHSFQSPLGEAARKNSLPLPLRLPTGNTDAVCASLASKISRKDTDTLPALVTALLAAGFGIRHAYANSTSDVFVVPGPNQGLALEAWEVAAVARRYDTEAAVSITNFAKGISTLLPDLGQAPLVAGLVAGIREGAVSNQPARRFLARLIVELGRHAPEPYDLLGSQLDASKIRFDAIQSTLLLLRFAGDLRGLAVYSAPRPAAFYDQSGQHILTLALFRPEQSVHAAALIQDSGKLPCTLDETAGMILDINATAQSTMFGSIWRWVGEHIPKAERFVTGLDVLSRVLGALKLFLSYAMVDIQIEMDPPVLQRTDSTMDDGQQARLRATAKMDTGKSQEVNCLRMALNGFGLDFDLPQDGPLAGVGAGWSLLEGGQRSIRDVPLEEIRRTQGRILRGRVRLAAVGRGNIIRQVTNDDGVTEVLVEGIRQDPSFEGLALHPVDRYFTVQVGFQLKSAKPTGRGLASDAVDAIGSAIALWGGDPVDALTETLSRSNVAMASRRFLVKDWAPQWYCSSSGQTYESAGECEAKCKVSLANFIGCVPRKK